MSFLILDVTFFILCNYQILVLLQYTVTESHAAVGGDITKNRQWSETNTMFTCYSTMDMLQLLHFRAMDCPLG